MIYNQLTDSFITSNIFENVVLKDKKIEHEYSLKTEVIKLYQTFEEDKSYAVLKLKFDLVKDEKIVKSFNFDKKYYANRTMLMVLYKLQTKLLKRV